LYLFHKAVLHTETKRSGQGSGIWAGHVHKYMKILRRVSAFHILALQYTQADLARPRYTIADMRVWRSHESLSISIFPAD